MPLLRHLLDRMRSRRAAIAVEFAIVAGPFLFMLFAIVESGMVFVANIDLSNATMALARQIRTGTVVAAGTSASTNGVVLSLADFKTAICNRMGLVSNSTCSNQLQVDLRTPSTFGGEQSASSPLSNGSFNTASLCFYSGSAGSVVEFRAFYLWPIVTPLLFNALVNASSYTANGQTTTGNYRVLLSSEAFRVEQNSSGTNSGNGC